MSLKGFVANHAQWTDFCAELDSSIAAQHKIMEQAADMITLHQAQGAIMALRRLKLLRDKYKDAK